MRALSLLPALAAGLLAVGYIAVLRLQVETRQRAEAAAYQAAAQARQSWYQAVAEQWFTDLVDHLEAEERAGRIAAQSYDQRVVMARAIIRESAGDMLTYPTSE